MPSLSPLRVALALLAAVAVFLIAAAIFGHTETVCQVDQAGEPTNCVSYNRAVYIILRIGDISNYYGPLITAFAAIAIAGFIWSLRQSLDRALTASEPQIAALVAAEKQRSRQLDRAYVAIETHGVSLVPLADSPSKMRTVAGVAIENNGHTPALLKELYAEFRDSSPVGDQPTYAGGQTWALNFQIGGHKPKIFLDKEFPFYSAKATHQYFLGYVTYADIYGETHTSRFCALLMPHRDKWSHAGPSAWNAWD
jgi:hypothetical protein